MPNNIDEILASIASLETQLATLKISLGATGVVVPRASKAKAKAPKASTTDDSADAAPKALKGPNVWIVFTQKVHNALKAASISTGAATVSKQFASSLKESKPYTDWTDEAIVEAWGTWEKPEQSKSGKAKSEKGSATESGSESGGEAPKKERKKRAPLTEVQKAERKAKAAAKKASVAAPGPLPASESDDDAPVAEAPAVVAVAAAKSTTKKVGAKAAAPSYTIEQLADFDEVEVEGAQCGRNIRGDVIDSDSNFIGHWDAKAKKLDRSAALPADWEAVKTAM
jgi:hypothetical protein